MRRYALGLDYGTNTCRAVIVDLADGCEVGTSVFAYPHGKDGVVVDARDPNVARQDPQDYLDGLVATVQGAVKAAKKADKSFDPGSIVGIGVDTTGSTPMAVDRRGVPLGLKREFRSNPAALAWLWKDHTAHEEAALITERAAKLRPKYLAKCGGTYSSEWFWSKILHCKKEAPEVFDAAYSFVECCDWLPAVLAGRTDPLKMTRGVCSAGHKAMYCEEWGGLPDKTFLKSLDPALAGLRDRLYAKAVPADQPAGKLSREWAAKLGLRAGIVVATGAFDAHMGAVGSGIREGVLVKILGTSTCDMMVQRHDKRLRDIPGVCGIVDGSILPGYFGIEAGQSAVGDIFLWFVNHLVPDKYGRTPEARFKALADAASKLAPGEHGLLALDWNNGNRCVLVDVRLSGLLVGQTLHTEAHEIYRALIEATAFGALTIVKRIEKYGVPVREIVNCGGLAVKNRLLMQTYADVTGRPMKVSRSDQTCALGAAIFGAVAAGPRASGFQTVGEAQDAMTGVRSDVYQPDAARGAVYGRLYELYSSMHDAFGTRQWSGKLSHVMKELIAIREESKGLAG